MERLKNIGVILINKSVLYSLYSDLKRPDEKVPELERKGLVIRVKRDLYVVSPKVHNQEISRELVPNHLYSPSYVSLETALAYYGLIPEMVYSVRSVCTKMHKNYDRSETLSLSKSLPPTIRLGSSRKLLIIGMLS